MLFNNRKPEDQFAGPATFDREPRHAAASATSLNTPPSMMKKAGPPPRCVIDAGLTISGDLESERDVQLDGHLKGNIRCLQLIISRDAALDGDIEAEEVVIRGRVKGTIRAAQVMLQDTARVESDIYHKSLVVEPGAVFDGESHRTDKPAAADLQNQVASLQNMAADMKAGTPGDKDKAAAA
jgi:cytoskeletal protein CcmA (bactofilin family)